MLLVVPRPSARRDVSSAARLGMTYDHSEHALTLAARPATPPQRIRRCDLRQATIADIPTLSDLFRDGFGDDGFVDPARLSGERSRTLMIDRGWRDGRHAWR